ncbi:MAG: hypothetical protein QXY40_03745 [Candidatus Methanomethylicia archaeon]
MRVIRNGFQRDIVSKNRPIEGVVDVGVVVIAHFKNLAGDEAFNFLSEALVWRRKILIPVQLL